MRYFGDEGFVIKDQKHGKVFRYHCIRCGECCRGTYTILIRPDDVSRWIADGREDIVAGMQIDMKSISQAGIHDILSSFLMTHEYIGDAKPPGEGSIPRWNIPGIGSRAILRPRDLATVQEAMARGIGYTPIMHLHGHCEFLQGNDPDGWSCSIQDTKPADCRGFPVKAQLEANEITLVYFLATCRGVQELKVKSHGTRHG